MDWMEIGKWVAGILAGGVVFKFVSNRISSKKSSIRITSQKNNSAGGDIVGGDSTKTEKK
jgi:hypothetical protein